jgi:type IV secretory pathway VirD2 relaxase
MDDFLLEFELQPGRIGNDGGRAVGRGGSLSRQLARGAGAARQRLARSSGKARAPAGVGRCSRIGRGQDVANVLKHRASRRQAAGQRSRRVVVKARIVRLRRGGQAAGAHLRYLVRDGVTRGGEAARLYGAETDAADGAEFTERGAGDRHQFRFIVAPEDGAELSDLRSCTRELMDQMERDLGTRLDWVAVDHFNTGHPHSHVVVRGKDDRGGDLIIAQDYITAGLRHRAEDLVTLELGQETQLEVARKLAAEVSAERLTRLDRAMIADLDSAGRLDLRSASGQVRAEADTTLRLGRLKTLERMGLAEQIEPGVWTISQDIEPTLRALGERGDILRAMSRALSRRGEFRSRERMVVNAGGEGSSPKIGRVIDKRLVDELDDRMGLIVDGIDGRVRHVEVDSDAAAQVPIGAVVETGPRPTSRPADRTIAQLSDGGVYSPSDHQEWLESGDLRLPPGANAGDLVEAHVRRLEALRRAGVVERLTSEAWAIPGDFLARAEALEAAHARRAQVRLLSALDLEAQITSDGATWLDRRLVAKGLADVSPHGFGGEVGRALALRQDELVRQGHAERSALGEWCARPDLLRTLERQELNRVGATLAADRDVPFKLPKAGDEVRGKLTGSLQLASGRFAILEGSFEFSLVPWRQALDRYAGREIAGTVEPGGGVTWQLGRNRGLSL